MHLSLPVGSSEIRCRNITYYNRARLPESHIWLQCRLSQRAQTQYKRAHHLDIVWRGCWNMHELAYCCWWWEWFVILHCIAHSNAIYPNIVQFNRALLLSKKREEDSHLQLFISRSSIHFISFSFWFFLYSLLLPPLLSDLWFFETTMEALKSTPAPISSLTSCVCFFFSHFHFHSKTQLFISLEISLWALLLPLVLIGNVSKMVFCCQNFFSPSFILFNPI